MNEWEDPLCCCEYFNIYQERSHILACCCNCVDLDDSVDSLITGKSIPLAKRRALMASLQDRIRIPWRGGARQVSLDAILPIFIIPALLFIAAYSFWCTIFMFSLLPGFLLYIYICFRKIIPQTKFFVVFSITSLITLIMIFQFAVIPFLEILPEENILVSFITAISVFGFYYCRVISGRWYVRSSDACEENSCQHCGKVQHPRMHHCHICHVCVPEKDHHSIWIDCCVGQQNKCLFVFSLTLAIIALLYSSNLTLTSVCHPYRLYKTVLIPDDCSEVYEQYDLALCFVSAIYSILLACVLTVKLLHYILLISIGVTGQEWASFSLTSQLFCAFNQQRPYSRGICSNWLRFICCRYAVYKPLNEL